MANVNQVSFGLPVDYTADQQRIAHQQALAQMLQQQSMQPLESQAVPGGLMVPISPLQGVAKLAQALAGSRMREQAWQDTTALSRRITNERAALLAQALSQDASGKRDLLRVATSMMSSGDPGLTAAGTALFQTHMKTLEPVKLRPGEILSDPSTRNVLLENPLQVTPDTKARLEQSERHWASINPYQQAQLGQGQQRIDQAQRHWETISPYQQAQLGQGQQRIGLDAQGLGLRRWDALRQAGEAAFNLPPQYQPPPVPGVGLGGHSPMIGPQQQPQGTPSARPLTPVPLQGMGNIAPVQGPVQQPQSVPMVSQANAPLIANPNIAPRQRSELELAKPASTMAASTSAQNLDRLAQMSGELRNHSGLSGVTGKINQFGALDVLPETRAARGLLNSIISQVGIAALNAMREASKTGGAVGQVTEREWPILQQSIAALDAAQGTPDFQRALDNLMSQIARTRQGIVQAYESTYGPLQYRPPAYHEQGRRSAGADVLPNIDDLVNEMRRRGM